MFSFERNEKMDDLLGRVSKAMQDIVLPLEPKLAGRPFAECGEELASARKKIQDAGLWAPQVPTEYGGLGLTFREHGLVSEVLGRSPLGHYTFGCQAPDAGNMEVLHMFGTDAQKEQYLAPLARGDIRSCFSMTEPENAGSNPAWLSTTAKRDGDNYVINGRKWFTSSASRVSGNHA